MENLALSALKARGYQMIAGQLVRHDSHGVPPRLLSSTSNEAAKVNKPKAKREPSQLSLTFHELWKRMNGPDLTPEHRFHLQRKFRFDFAHLPTMTAIELEGGIFIKGRHSRPKGMQMDADKYNLAASMGWVTLRLTTGQITHDRLQLIIQTIHSRAQPTAPP